jgi:hypothetical protein
MCVLPNNKRLTEIPTDIRKAQSADDIVPIQFNSARHLLLALCLRKKENPGRIAFSGRYTMPKDPLASDQERIAEIASNIFVTTGWRFK